MEDATGLMWETVFSPSWPSIGQAEDLERVIDSGPPDLVTYCCAAYRVSYPSVSLRLRRADFSGARQSARLGSWSATKPLLKPAYSM